MTICKRFYISGLVQGVWYRASAQQRAKALELTGYAKNLANGQVEVVACGEPKALETFESWLWEGSSASTVEEVSAENIAFVAYRDFQTR